MYKKDFLLLLRSRLVEALPKVFNSRLSQADTELVFNTVMEAIVSEVARGDEVRALPYGRFYAKPIHRRGSRVNMKLGFTSYEQLDTRMTDLAAANDF